MRFIRFAYRTFLRGLLTLLPLTLTLYLLSWIVSSADSAFSEPLMGWVPESLYFPGAGVVVAVILIFSAGLIFNHYLAQKIFDWIESRLQTLPIVRSIYGPIRDVTQLFSNTGQTSSQRVVMVTIGGVEMIGLITREQFSDLPSGMVKNENVAVFVPFSYAMGGFTVVAPKSAIRETTLPADRALQMAVTGWIKASKSDK